MLLFRSGGLDIVVHTRDENLSVGVLHLREQLDQAENRIGRRAAVLAGVQVARGPTGFDFAINQTTQANTKRRNAFGVLLRVGD